jgi:hypothetical protein
MIQAPGLFLCVLLGFQIVLIILLTSVTRLCKILLLGYFLLERFSETAYSAKNFFAVSKQVCCTYFNFKSSCV